MKYQTSPFALLSLFAAAMASSYADVDIGREFAGLNLLRARQLTNLQVRRTPFVISPSLPACPSQPQHTTSPSTPSPPLTPLLAFTPALGGAVAPPITSTGDPKRPFQVGNSDFTDFASAANRSCDDQHNACAKIANDKALSNGLRVTDCDVQMDACKAAQKSATVTSFAVKTSSDAQFDYFCDP